MKVLRQQRLGNKEGTKIHSPYLTIASIVAVNSFFATPGESIAISFSGPLSELIAWNLFSINAPTNPAFANQIIIHALTVAASKVKQ